MNAHLGVYLHHQVYVAICFTESGIFKAGQVKIDSAKLYKYGQRMPLQASDFVSPVVCFPKVKAVFASALGRQHAAPAALSERSGKVETRPYLHLFKVPRPTGPLFFFSFFSTNLNPFF